MSPQPGRGVFTQFGACLNFGATQKTDTCKGRDGTVRGFRAIPQFLRKEATKSYLDAPGRPGYLLALTFPSVPLPRLDFTAQDRLMVLAPHPDDESLACGGLIMRAAQAGAAVRVIFATNGDNNPWPQRYLERRWRVGPEERRRWGARRRAEALRAIQTLGLPAQSACFLEFPDQGFTDALLRADRQITDVFAREIREWRPTLLVLPSPNDTHRDHNAIAVLYDLLLRRLAADHQPTVIHYPVHPCDQQVTEADLTLSLNYEAMKQKLDAVLCHQSQMALSEKRFVAFVRPEESYLSAVWDTRRPDHHPVKLARVEKGELRLLLNVDWTWSVPRLFVATEQLLDGQPCQVMRLRKSEGPIRVTESVTGRLLQPGTLKRVDGMLELRLPWALPETALAYVKVDRRWSFYDWAGWVKVRPASSG